MSFLSSGGHRLRALLVLGVLIPALQFVPYGRDHENPTVVREPAWDSPQTRYLAKRACFDCHSNETVWPWYANIAPASWLVTFDVREGRHHLNFSDWRQGQREGEDISKVREVVEEGEMPPMRYRLMHAEARLSSWQKTLLVRGLAKTFKTRR
jgi:hypothetical protein